jgi:hypothetical protein
MSTEQHHQGALLETARLELDRAHRAAIVMEAAEVRRGLGLAQTALRDAAAEPEGSCYDSLAARVTTALADLDGGDLIEMAKIIEDVRRDLEAA